MRQTNIIGHRCRERSTMTVKDGMTAFKIQTKGKEHAYGYNPSAINGDKGRIPGLAQLVRKMYQISYDGAIFGNYDEAKENKYTVSKLNASSDSVYFKENNFVLSWRKVLAIIITMRSWRLVQMVSSVTIRLVFLTMTLTL